MTPAMANRHCLTNGCHCRGPFLPRALTLSCAQTAARQEGGERTSSIAAEGSWVSLTSNTGINKYINKMGMKTVATLQSSNKVERKCHQKAFCPPETQDKEQGVTAQGRMGSEAGTEDIRGRALEPYSYRFKSQLRHVSALYPHLPEPLPPHLYKEEKNRTPPRRLL